MKSTAQASRPQVKEKVSGKRVSEAQIYKSASMKKDNDMTKVPG